MTRSISPPPTKRRKISPRLSRCSSPTFQSQQHLPPSASSNAIRVYSWNINGIAPFLQPSITNYFAKSKFASPSSTSASTPAPASLREFLHRHGWPEVLLLQEVKIANNDRKTQDAIRRAINTPLSFETEMSKDQKGPKYDAHFTLPTDKFNARGLGGTGKVYGVCTIHRSDIPSIQYMDVDIRTVDWDKEGRVSIIQLLPHVSQDYHKLAIFNIYAVNGTENLYRDPRTGVVKGTRHDRKLVFHRLLAEECLKMEREGWAVMMAGDFNVAPDARDGHPKLRTWPMQHCVNRADFLYRFLGATTGMIGRMEEKEKLVKEDEVNRWHGVDVWRETHQHERNYTYHSRTREWGSSCDRVDYVLASKGLFEAGNIFETGILDSEVERGPSDHVPVFASIRLNSV